jgi:hypothetical protein
LPKVQILKSDICDISLAHLPSHACTHSRPGLTAALRRGKIRRDPDSG